MRLRYRIERALPRTTVLSNHRRLYPQSFDSLFRNDRNHDESCDGIADQRPNRALSDNPPEECQTDRYKTPSVFASTCIAAVPSERPQFSRRFIDLPFRLLEASVLV